MGRRQRVSGSRASGAGGAEEEQRHPPRHMHAELCFPVCCGCPDGDDLRVRTWVLVLQCDRSAATPATLAISDEEGERGQRKVVCEAESWRWVTGGGQWGGRADARAAGAQRGAALRRTAQHRSRRHSVCARTLRSPYSARSVTMRFILSSRLSGWPMPPAAPSTTTLLQQGV